MTLPSLHILLFLSMSLVGIAPSLFWRRRFRTRLATFALGAASWALAVALKVAWALPLNAAVKRALEAQLGGLGAVSFMAYVGVLTGVFEVGLVAILARTVKRLRAASWDDAVAFGLSFGGIEAVVLALAGAFQPGDVGALQALLATLERASTIPIHVLSCVLVLRAADDARPWRPLALAFLYKSVVDGFAAWAILGYGVKTSTSKMLVFEVVLAAFAALSAVVVAVRAPREPLLSCAQTTVGA
jgi:hypothetical protein